MRKIFFLSLISLIIITVSLFTGCSIFNRSNSSKPPEEQRQEEKVSEGEITEPEQQMPAEKPREDTPREDTPEYEVIEDLDTLPEKIAETLEHLKRQRGYFVFNPKDYGTGNDLYVLISAGEKPTGGYSINIDSLTLQNNTLKVVVKEQEPAAEDGVIQVITYPLVVVKMYDLIEGIYVIDEDNEEFKGITTKNLPSD
ncbi:MAG: protease complex subunit PrcB family protein [Firmicutes bacterium]|nr:protease complex subunit PrcB family protein [Bacillota bacterium]